MDIDKKLDEFKEIHPVEAPPFMLTRIMEKVNSSASFPVSAQWKLSFAFVSVLIVMLNVGIVYQSTTAENSVSTEELIGLDVTTSNQLYNE